MYLGHSEEGHRSTRALILYRYIIDEYPILSKFHGRILQYFDILIYFAYTKLSNVDYVNMYIYIYTVHIHMYIYIYMYYIYMYYIYMYYIYMHTYTCTVSHTISTNVGFQSPEPPWGLSMSFLTVQAMRYAISGILPNQEGAHRAPGGLLWDKETWPF